MEELSLRYEQLLKAYDRLTYMVETFQELSRNKAHMLLKSNENELITHRDALIQRFEFCYELTWKFLKVMLRELHAVDVASPRAVFKACYDQVIFDQEETELLIEVMEMRNRTSHVYDEEMVDEISRKIVSYYDQIIVIIGKIRC